jgi:hypothetical protein
MPRRPIRSLLPALALSLSAAATAAAAPALELLLDAGADGIPTVSAIGEAADGCPRQLVGAVLQARTLVLRAQRATAGCHDEPIPVDLDSRSLRNPLPALPGGVLRLRVDTAAEPQAPARPEAFALVERGEGRSPVHPEAGFWWGDADGEFPTAAPGFGVQLEIQGDTVAVAVSGYDDAGAPQWLFGAAPFSGRSARLELGRLLGGGGPFGGFRPPQAVEPAGRLHIEWLDAARAVFWFERPAADGAGIDLQPVSMVRFGFAGERQWRGRWLLAGERSSDLDVPVRAIDFVTVEQQRDRVRVHASNGDLLECSLDPRRQGSPPVRCELATADGLQLVFDDVGFGRLHGVESVRGQRAVLLRPDR